MCRRIHIKTSSDEIVGSFPFAQRGEIDSLGDRLPRYNGFPTQVYPIIVRDIIRKPNMIGPVFAPARWEFLAPWMKPGRRQPLINAPCEGIAAHDLFQLAYRSRRCLIPLNGFFEWDAVKNKQPYAIAMKDGSPFALAGIWDIWHHPAGLDIRNFAIVTCAANKLVGTIHDRMPVILHRKDYQRWLSSEPDPSDLMKPFDAEAMTMWPIARRASIARNVGPEIVNRVNLDAR
ncbi:hypothetical protein AMC83_CH03058 [Rhizobium phaseoli]|uniref:SOS response-associated peptidase n=1 Tax=Rhizobium phaseoli TaxID=396 RepID=UPI0007EB4F42|nr:SOS response-associated peptidase [Rhizobium phaseoli]ANL73013.1 hypothetical protein AMC83_CH03058 [Rhizobium phaseoli]